MVRRGDENAERGRIGRRQRRLSMRCRQRTPRNGDWLCKPCTKIAGSEQWVSKNKSNCWGCNSACPAHPKRFDSGNGNGKGSGKDTKDKQHNIVLSLIHIPEPTRQAESSSAVFLCQ